MLVILAARAIMLEDALDDRIVRIHSEELFIPPFPPRLSYLTALGFVPNRERLHGSCEVSG